MEIIKKAREEDFAFMFGYSNECNCACDNFPQCACDHSGTAEPDGCGCDNS